MEGGGGCIELLGADERAEWAKPNLAQTSDAQRGIARN